MAGLLAPKSTISWTLTLGSLTEANALVKRKMRVTGSFCLGLIPGHAGANDEEQPCFFYPFWVSPRLT